MHNDEHQKSGLDDDILQCKADLQKALQAAGRFRPNRVKSCENAPAESVPLQQESIQDSETPESTLSDSANPKSHQAPVGIRILPFEALHKKSSPAVAAGPPASREAEADKSASEESIAALKDKIHLLERQLEALPDEHRRQMAVLEARLQGQAVQFQELTEQSRRFQENLDASVHTAEARQHRIDELERELAEKIGLIASLKQQIEENAAALAARTEQIHLSDQTKEDLEKQLAEKADAWAEALAALKAAEESAAHTLAERQQQLDVLREELSAAEHRLEQADSTNATLTRENAELLETLEQARRDARESAEAALLLGSAEQEADMFEELPPEPYCEPVGEVISEDDVHLEQKLAGESIPAFNLAEQIMAEQRKASAGRRQGPAVSREKSTPSNAMEHVMNQYVSAGRTPESPSLPETAPQSAPSSRSDRFLHRSGERLSGYQESLLGAIIQKDIRRFCGMEMSAAAWSRPMDN